MAILDVKGRIAHARSSKAAARPDVGAVGSGSLLGVTTDDSESFASFRPRRGFPRTSEQQAGDLERGVIQNCLPFQDLQKFQPHSRILLCLAVPELEP